MYSIMRPSPQRHILAVLRTFLGLTQKEMADLAKCSRPTIQAIELGKLKLGKDLAMRISTATACSLETLLDGDPSRPLLSVFKKPYEVADFKVAQSVLKTPPAAKSEWYLGAYYVMAATLADVFLAAFMRGDRHLFLYQAGKALESLAKEFGAANCAVPALEDEREPGSSYPSEKDFLRALKDFREDYGVCNQVLAAERSKEPTRSSGVKR